LISKEIGAMWHLALLVSYCDVKFEVFIAVKIQAEVFWVVMLCNVVVGYQCFRGPCCLHLHQYGGSKVIWNIQILPQHYMASQPRRPQLESFVMFSWLANLILYV
jgi:hypothetical protein